MKHGKRLMVSALFALVLLAAASLAVFAQQPNSDQKQDSRTRSTKQVQDSKSQENPPSTQSTPPSTTRTKTPPPPPSQTKSYHHNPPDSHSGQTTSTTGTKSYQYHPPDTQADEPPSTRGTKSYQHHPPDTQSHQAPPPTTTYTPPPPPKTGFHPPAHPKPNFEEQHGSWSRYQHHLEEEQPLGKQFMENLQREKRLSHYRYQQRYARQLDLLKVPPRIDYRRDPFFRTPFDRRYRRDGIYYETNIYGVRYLQNAVRRGYEEGYRAGRADREDRWQFDLEGCFAFRDANYGYNGYYISQNDYNYYFREGFRRGYEDGYHGRFKHGRYSNGKYIILSSVLAGIVMCEMLD